MSPAAEVLQPVYILLLLNNEGGGGGYLCVEGFSAARDTLETFYELQKSNPPILEKFGVTRGCLNGVKVYFIFML